MAIFEHTFTEVIKILQEREPGSERLVALSTFLDWDEKYEEGQQRIMSVGKDYIRFDYLQTCDGEVSMYCDEDRDFEAELPFLMWAIVADNFEE